PDLHGYSILEHGDAVENTRYETSMWIPPAGQSEQCTGICGQQGGSEKILFGTDTYSCAFQFGRIALSALSEQDKENILYRNAMRLFPAAF
ncbi:MAG: hypothetical protein II979_09335, partial [Clostridia bacterium]|nr:hypothetical protein [Clostridia bacterium]